tara:strand:+ start:4401 stop:5066 length:666 start_codon:yes stop_codon:yes gene_type:complete
MKAIIPAKTNSGRVFDKNWRKFYKDQCMVEIKVKQLIEAGIEDVYVSCEDESKREQIESWGAHFILRDVDYTLDSMHWSDVVTEVISSIPECPEDEAVAWVCACTPLFEADDLRVIMHLWKTMDSKYDSLITVKKLQEFILNERGKPLNFSFGRWHEWSQDLPQWYILECPINIMKKSTYLRCNYYVGAKPCFHVIPSPSIDIDTPDEFQLAQEIYSLRHK